MVMVTTQALGRTISALLGLLFVLATQQAYGQGIAVTGVGPVNRSMGGACTAAPLESLGALNWNPGSISGLIDNEVSFGAELLLANITLSSSVGGSSGSTDGESGVAVIPAVGWVHHLEESPISIGFGMYGIGGFRNNMPADPSNPILASGPIFADAELMQIAPTISYQLTERLSVGAAPTITLARMMFDPLGPSVITPTPTPGSGNREHWGGGFQVGAYYTGENNWNFGCSLKSPQWFETFRFFTPSGVTKFNLDYPLTVSLGTAYTGFERWVIAADVRYFDYGNAPGFRALGWNSVFAGAIGAQYQASDRWKLRMGYNFNENPIGTNAVALNIADPLIQTHNIATGCSYAFTPNVDINLAYVYLVNNKVTGPLLPPFAPSDTISNEIAAHSLALGVTVRYR